MKLRVIEMDFLKWLESIRTEPLTQFVEGINLTGDVLFFTVMLPIIYWLFSKRLGIVLALTLFASLFINVLLKDIIEIIRPFRASDLTSIVDQSGYSFPSGHAQHSFAFWVTIALFLRNRWFWLLSIFIILLVGLARMYSGVHYPLDVLGGWIVAAAIIYCIYIINKSRLLVKLNNAVLLIGAAALSLGGLVLYEAVVHQPLDQEGAYQAAGLLLFAIVGYVLESNYLKFEIKHSIIVKICTLVLGLIGLLLIKEGVKLILPEHVWSDFIRYGLLAIWTIYIAPLLFVLLRLARKTLN